jgi:hypothetical protein
MGDTTVPISDGTSKMLKRYMQDENHGTVDAAVRALLYSAGYKLSNNDTDT